MSKPIVPHTPLFFPTPGAFRRWLARHGSTASELLVGFYKVASGRPSLTWSESVDEALCFGWIDGVRKRIDDVSYQIRFTPRRPDSNWSAINIARAKELCFTGNKIDAQTACAWGLVNRVTEPSDLLSSCQILGAQMADCVPEALRAYKRLINASLALPLPEALRYEANVAQEFGRGVRAVDVAARRDAILERGRNQ